MGRVQGRLTKEDVKVAGLRRWDARSRITTDWLSLYQEPELCFGDGDCLVYLREPGKSGRGPAFRIHSAKLQERGFEWLTRQCLRSRPLPPTTRCVMSACPGCSRHPALRELYLPAPARAEMQQVLDYHVTTRNFFAWLYDLPLVGRALGESLVHLENRIAAYGSHERVASKIETMNYAESQGYLDFRECLDHALAAMYVAENFQVQDLFVDALAHSAGLSHTGLTQSVEYRVLSPASKDMIDQAILDMDIKIARVNHSAISFFENDLAKAFLGLHKAAKDHLDHFRSFLHSVYIEQHGFWPPDDFANGQTQRAIYTSMYADFRNLYLHLLDEGASNTAEAPIVTTGGVCVLQNLEAFDVANNFLPLSEKLPRLPTLARSESRSGFRKQRRSSWLSLPLRRTERDARSALAVQSLIDASNRDFRVMDNLLVRRYNEFEAQTALDESRTMTLQDGRKVRWILVYAVFQTLISVMQAPKQARNTEGLSYYLCCDMPSQMPWEKGSQSTRTTALDPDLIAPDTMCTHTNTSRSEPSETMRQPSKVERRQSLKLNTSSTSLRRMLTKKSSTRTSQPSSRRSSYCEIYVPGYGNGLNEVEVHRSPINDGLEHEKSEVSQASKSGSIPDTVDNDSTPSLSSSTSVSRESSNASNKTKMGKDSDEPDTPSTPSSIIFHTLREMHHTSLITPQGPINQIAAKSIGFPSSQQNDMPTVHFNVETWDALLR